MSEKSAGQIFPSLAQELFSHQTISLCRTKILLALNLLLLIGVEEITSNPVKQMLLMPALKKRLQVESTVGNLPALTGVLTDLQKYTGDPNSTISQISEQVVKDPSLSVRLLHMANSAYYNLSEEVVSIEEAVLFLGIEQIRAVSLSMACVEKMSPQDKSGFEWIDFWRHCIATAYFSRMIGRFFHRTHSDPELDYMAGLLHDVGKLVIAMLFPEGFGYIITRAREEKLSFSDTERAYFDTDHGALGGWYLERQKVPPIVSEAVRCHHNWTNAVDNQEIAAIVNVADSFCHECGIGSSGNMQESREVFTETEAWYFLTQRLRLRGDVVVLEERLRGESERLGGLVEIILPKAKQAPKKAIQESLPSPEIKPVVSDLSPPSSIVAAPLPEMAVPEAIVEPLPTVAAPPLTEPPQISVPPNQAVADITPFPTLRASAPKGEAKQPGDRKIASIEPSKSPTTTPSPASNLAFEHPLLKSAS